MQCSYKAASNPDFVETAMPAALPEDFCPRENMFKA
jgi:hypothetical protein